jgi:hypothetical protein
MKVSRVGVMGVARALALLIVLCYVACLTLALDTVKAVTLRVELAKGLLFVADATPFRLARWNIGSCLFSHPLASLPLLLFAISTPTAQPIFASRVSVKVGKWFGFVAEGTRFRGKIIHVKLLMRLAAPRLLIAARGFLYA